MEENQESIKGYY